MNGYEDYYNDNQENSRTGLSQKLVMYSNIYNIIQFFMTANELNTHTYGIFFYESVIICTSYQRTE